MIEIRTGWTLVVAALSLATLSPVPAPAKEARRADQAPATFTERATVELALIEVYATDSQGKPIVDLKPEDLVLTVDGHPGAIQALELHEVESPEAPRGTQPETPGRIPPGPEARSNPRRFLLFFEDGTSEPHGLTVARQAASRFIEKQIAPGDEVAVAVCDRSLHVLQDFTTDRALLRKALDDSVSDLKRYSDFASEQGAFETELASLQGTGKISTMAASNYLLLASDYGEEFTPRARRVLRSLSTLIDSLAPYPGYKAIVFMGDGVPENPAMDLVQRLSPGVATPDFFNRARKFDLSQDIQRLAHDAAAAGVTLHSIQTMGVASTADVEMRAAGRRTNALETLALNTGGTKSTSNDPFKGLQAAESSSRAYYILTYAPEGPPDGNYHTVQLRLKKRSGTLRWRRGFTRLLPRQVHEKAIQAAYLLPDRYAGMGLEINAVDGPDDTGGRVVDLVLHLPPGKALFVPRPEGRVARLEAGFVVIDGSGKESLRASREAILTVASGSGADLGVDFYSRVHLPRGSQTITAVVDDQGAGTMGAARLGIPAAVATPGVVLGLSIYSLRERSLWVEIPPRKESSSGDETAASVYTIGPTLKRTFTLGEKLACGFRLATPGATSGLRLAIREGEREVRSVAVQSSDLPGIQPAGAEAPLRIALPVDDLAAGDYTLVVFATDASGKENDLGRTPFRLEGSAPAS